MLDMLIYLFVGLFDAGSVNCERTNPYLVPLCPTRLIPSDKSVPSVANSVACLPIRVQLHLNQSGSINQPINVKKTIC